MANNGPSPHPPSLRLILAAHQPSRCHHAQSLLGPSFHYPRTPHVLESHPERATHHSHRDDEWSNAVSSHPVLELRHYLAACTQAWPLLKLSLFSLWPSLLQSVSNVSFLLNHWNPIFEPVCVFNFSSSALAVLTEMDFSFESLFAIWSLSPQEKIKMSGKTDIRVHRASSKAISLFLME